MLAGLLALSVAGCGLSDYQSRMDAQRERIQKFDDANQLLGDPIDSPLISGKGADSAWSFDFFLRIPKGYVVEKKPYGTNFPFFRYAGADPGYGVFVAAAVLIDKDAKERYGECSVARFRELVRLGIDDFYFQKYKSDARFHANKHKLFLPADIQYSAFAADLITPFSDVAEKIPYAFTSYKDAENKGNDKHVEFRVYFREEYGREIMEAGKRRMLPGKQVVIVAQAPIRGQNEQFDKSIQAALGTLDVSAEVTSKRAQYKRLKGS